MTQRRTAASIGGPSAGVDGGSSRREAAVDQEDVSVTKLASSLSSQRRRSRPPRCSAASGAAMTASITRMRLRMNLSTIAYRCAGAPRDPIPALRIRGAFCQAITHAWRLVDRHPGVPVSRRSRSVDYRPFAGSAHLPQLRSQAEPDPFRLTAMSRTPPHRSCGGASRPGSRRC